MVNDNCNLRVSERAMSTLSPAEVVRTAAITTLLCGMSIAWLLH